MAHSHHHPSRYPPAYLRPDNIAHTDINGVIYIETEMPPPPLPGPSTSTPPHPQPQSQSQQQQQPNFNDVAGVLRRNQACLNCRRRKLVSILPRHILFVINIPILVLMFYRNAMQSDHIVGHVYDPINT